MANFTEEEFQIELKTILNFYISRYETQEKPKAFLLGGQPGAGKSKLEYLINTQEKCAFVSGDDFRKYHPRFEELNNIYGQESSKHTQEWAGKMVENIVQKLRKKKINPKNINTYILFQVIFSSFTPLVPKQDKARNIIANSFVHRICENKLAVF